MLGVAGHTATLSVQRLTRPPRTARAELADDHNHQSATGWLELVEVLDSARIGRPSPFPGRGDDGGATMTTPASQGAQQVRQNSATFHNNAAYQDQVRRCPAGVVRRALGIVFSLLFALVGIFPAIFRSRTS